MQVEAGSVQVFLQEGNVPIPATRLSDGTLRYLCLLAILCNPTLPPLVCIEEPELGLHPDILPGLADLLREASETLPAHRHYALGHPRRCTDRNAGEHSCLREGGRADEAQTTGQGGAFPLAREVSARRVVDLRGARGESLVKVKVYVEGGGDSKDLRTRCRMGSSSFFENANLAGRMPRIIACGGRGSAFDKFRTALRSRRADEYIVLLVDSEDPVAKGSGTWEHLAGRDGWDTPADAADEHAHLMVQCMEAWFLADKDCLAAYFGQGFNRNLLPAREEIEEVAKNDVHDGLRNATRRSRKGEYRKGSHPLDVLERIDPAKVLAVSPHAECLIDTLREKAG